MFKLTKIKRNFLKSILAPFSTLSRFFCCFICVEPSWAELSKAKATRFDSAWLILVWLIYAQLGSAWFGFSRFGSAWLGLTRLGSVWLGLTRFYSAWLGLLLHFGFFSLKKNPVISKPLKSLLRSKRDKYFYCRNEKCKIKFYFSFIDRCGKFESLRKYPKLLKKYISKRISNIDIYCRFKFLAIYKQRVENQLTRI